MLEYPTYDDAVRGTYNPHIAASTILDYSVEEIMELFDRMTIAEQAEFEALIRNSPPRSLMRHQTVPNPFAKDRWWEVMLLLGGRGVGKTVALSFAIREHLRHFKRRARVGVGGPTQSDVRDIVCEGETGVITMFPNEFTKYNRSLGEARHIDGGIVKFMGTEKPKRWNGPQWSMIAFDEISLVNQQAWDDAMFGLRLKGPNAEDPYAVCAGTPKNRKFVKELAFQPTTYVPQYVDPVTNKRRIPTTFDNSYLPERRVAWLKNKYGGTRLGQQELLGLFIDDVAGAKFKRDWFVYETNPQKWPRMLRTIVAIDPAGSVARQVADTNALSEEQRQNQQKNADTGIAVIGLGVDGRIYVIYVGSGQWTPAQWGAKAISLFHEYHCSKIIAESNFGGLMVENTLRTVDVWDDKLRRQLTGRYLPIELITASKGKHIRAEPVATLYEQNTNNPNEPKIVHCQYFAAAETQMCSFVNADENEGADMVDALVWGVLHISGMADKAQSGIVIVPGSPQFNQVRIMR